MRSAHNSALPGLSLREIVPIDRDASRQMAGSTRRYRKSATSTAEISVTSFVTAAFGEGYNAKAAASQTGLATLLHT